MGRHTAEEGPAEEQTDEALLQSAADNYTGADGLLDEGLPELLDGRLPIDAVYAANTLYLGSIAASLQVIARRMAVNPQWQPESSAQQQ